MEQWRREAQSEYDSPRSGGLICISLKEDDELVRETNWW